MVLPLRKKGERTQPDYLTEIPVGKVCPSSLGVCSPPVWAAWEESRSSHGGLHLVVVLGMVTKPPCLPTFSCVGSLCYSSHLLHPLLLLSRSPAFHLWHLAEADWGGGRRSIPHDIPHAIWSLRNSGRLKFTSPGEGRGEAEWVCQSWAVEGATWTEAVGRISPQCHCGHLKS